MTKVKAFAQVEMVSVVQVEVTVDIGTPSDDVYELIKKEAVRQYGEADELVVLECDYR